MILRPHLRRVGAGWRTRPGEAQVLAHIPLDSFLLAILDYATCFSYASSFEPQVRDSYFTSFANEHSCIEALFGRKVY